MMKIFRAGFIILAGCFMVISLVSAGYAELMLDQFEKGSNLLGGRSNVYVRAPSRASSVWGLRSG